MKQSLYPVFQLTNGDTGFYTDYRDTRVRKMGTASSFASVYNFTGIVTLVNELLENQGKIKLDFHSKKRYILETVDKVKNCGLLLGCYGDLLAVDGIRNVSQRCVETLNINSNF